MMIKCCYFTISNISNANLTQDTLAMQENSDHDMLCQPNIKTQSLLVPSSLCMLYLEMDVKQFCKAHPMDAQSPPSIMYLISMIH